MTLAPTRPVQCYNCDEWDILTEIVLVSRGGQDVANAEPEGTLQNNPLTYWISGRLRLLVIKCLPG